MTESAHQPHESDSNNADDVENLQDIADKPAVESLSTAKRRGEAVTPGDIHLIPVPKEAWRNSVVRTRTKSYHSIIVYLRHGVH